MTTKKTVTKKPVKKATFAPKFIGVNCDGEVFVSEGPIQLSTDGACIWPSQTYGVNYWSDCIEDSRFKQIHDLPDLPTHLFNSAFCCTYPEFIKRFPEYANYVKGTKEAISTRQPLTNDKQVKFSL